MTERYTNIRLETSQPALSVDYFVKHKPFQPKSEIAAYVESEGIPVPQIFGSLGEAVDSGKPFIVRSEHPQDYDGVSGLLDSYKVTAETLARSQARVLEIGSKIKWHKLDRPDLRDIRDIERQLIARVGDISQEEFESGILRINLRQQVKDYCELVGISLDEFSAQTTWSYWELLEGHNRSIVADSAIEDRYHLFATQGYNHNYTIVDNGNIIFAGPRNDLFDDPERDMEQLIGFYEQVRHLPRFASEHCPIVEAQTVDGVNYFLQYHRAADFDQAQFKLTREPEDTEVVGTFVRGATPPEGIVCDTRYWYGKDYKIEHEDASFHFHSNFAFTELMLRRRKVQFIPRNMAELADETYDRHLPKSKLFKSKVAIGIDRGNLHRKILYKYDNAKHTDNINPKTVHSQLQVVSDGRKAYVKPLSLSYGMEEL